MGIDPGYDRCGYAVVESEAMGSYRLLDSGALTTLRTDSLAMRLLSIARGLDQLIALQTNSASLTTTPTLIAIPPN